MIEVEDVTKVYDMGLVQVHALRGVSLTIEPGEWVAVMGPSGSGKSTLLHILGCLDTPTSGSYRLNGTEVGGMDEDELAAVRNQQIGFVFQTFNLLARTAAVKQVMLPMQYVRNGDQMDGDERRQRAEDALAMVGLGDRMEHLPAELSGGQQQRVAIARALINDPAIIMADEPTGNLDSKSGAEVMAILNQLHTERGITLVTITHEEDIAAQAERVVRLLDGRIVEDEETMMNELAENVRTAWDGLLANKLRSGLTMLGVVIGVAAVVALLSIGEGARRSITDRISSAGTNLLFVSPGAAFAAGPVRGASGSAATLTLDDAQAIADPLNVGDASVVAAEFTRRAQVIFGDSNANVSITGTTEEYLAAFDLSLARGRFIDERDLSRRSKVAVLGSQVATDLFGGFDPVGQKVKMTLSGQGVTKASLTVVGVLEEQGGSMLADADDAVIVPISTAQTKLFDGRNPLGKLMVTRVNVVAESDDRATAVEDQITTLLSRRHGIRPDQDADFRVMSQAEMLEMASEVTGVLSIFLGSIAGISLLVGGIGIMNIMLVSVTERTREIGLRKAVGARKSDILTQFLLESVVLSALGGVVGVLLGIGIARIVDLSGVMRAEASPTAVALALGAALAVGLFFGIYPANRAAALSPIEALRYE